MRIAINGMTPKAEHLAAMRRLIELASERSAEPLCVNASLYDIISDMLPPDTVRCAGAPDADVALSIGGDGTFLRTVQWVAGADIAILGINTGHLGYLADLSIEEAVATECEPFAVQERTLLEVNVEEASASCLPADFWPYALNEVAFLKKDTSSMITAETFVNGAPLTTYLADGLLVATPTGSTGYNLSVGGPIIEPTAPAVVLAPVAPHSLTMRPLVLSDTHCISVVTDSRADSFLLSLDGRSVALPVGTRVDVSQAPFTVKVLQRASRNFADTLRTKLLWGRIS